ncbi:MAG: hypothetical protein RMK29_05365 [Myxococcales bacterium]|nr:hypothetical protein [Myxococcota bacterium]MDW8281120.1 hypothetical protein [Myxococcales bacterium]
MSLSWEQLLDEVGQRYRRRQPLLREIEAVIGRRVVSYFISLRDAVAMVDDGDSDVLEEALRGMDLSSGLTLLINAPGGDGLAAERIVRICRSYSRGDFEVIVPRMAKSAATMICFGANCIWMSETSELGPVDPQVGWMEQDRMVRMSARELILSYETLLRQAEACQGNVEPYIQQLARYDARLIETYRTAEALSESIAVGLLRCAMMRDVPEAEVRERIRPFLEVEQTRSHARAIYHDRAASCGLQVRLIQTRSPLWERIWELYLRSSYVVDHGEHAKLVETAERSFRFAPKGHGPVLVSEPD